MAAYNFGIAKDASSISAEISSDAFDRNPILNNANKAINSNSLYGNKHRFIIVASKRYDYGRDKKWGTTISLFGSWTSGSRFAYVYGGDINNDGTGSNDLLYVPTDGEIDNMIFTPLLDVNGVLQTWGVTPTLYGNGSFYIQTGDGWSAFVRADGTWTIWNEANEQEFDSSDVTSDSGPVRVVEVSRIGA